MGMDFKTGFNKAVAIGICLLFLSVSIGWALTRTITDTGDTVDTFIRNSRGNYWTATWANVQLAVDDLNNTANGGGIVTLPAVNFSVTSTCYIRHAAITIQGAGGVILANTGSPVTGTLLRIAANLPAGVFKVTGKNDVAPLAYYVNPVFMDFTIEESDIWTSPRPYRAVGINLTGTRSAIIERVNFVQINGSAIWVDTTYASTIRDCYFDRCGYKATTWLASQPVIYYTAPVGYFNTDAIIEDNVFEACYYAWITVNSTGTKMDNMVIKNNYFEGSKTNMNFGISPSGITLISENKFWYPCNQSYINLSGDCAKYTKIIGNIFKQSVHNGGEGYADIVAKNTYDILISNNLFLEGTSAIYTDIYTRNVTITDNIIDNFPYPAVTTKTYGMWIRSKDTIISDNNFMNIGVANDYDDIALYFSSAKNCTVRDNKFSGCERGIELNTGGYHCHNIIIEGNNLLRITDSGYTIYADSNQYIRDNRGYVTENWGNTSVANNGTISHGLATTPTTIIITCQNWNLTVAVTRKTSTTFTVSIRDYINFMPAQPPGGSYYIFWYAKV